MASPNSTTAVMAMPTTPPRELIIAFSLVIATALTDVALAKAFCAATNLAVVDVAAVVAIALLANAFVFVFTATPLA